MTSSSAPLANLTSEHRLISQVVAALESYAGLLETNEAPVEDLAAFSDFFSGFSELVHHEKEEDILLSEMVKHGFQWDVGSVDRTRKEHEQEKYLVRVLRQAARQEGGWGREDRRHALASIRALIEFQRNHIKNEDAILYPAAIERLSSEILAEIDRRLADFDEKKIGSEKLRTLSEVAQRLIEKYAAS